jgi:hypothetical protein
LIPARLGLSVQCRRIVSPAAQPVRAVEAGARRIERADAAREHGSASEAEAVEEVTTPPTQFVIRAYGDVLKTPLWVSSKWPDGRRDLVPRQLAAVFPSIEDATVAGTEVDPALRQAGIFFIVQPDG